MSTPTWRWVESHEGLRLVEGERDVLEIYESHGGGQRPTPEDARRIAALPELLAAAYAARHQLVAVTGMVTNVDHRANLDRAIALIDAAIKKAEG